MVRYLQKKLALSQRGAKDLVLAVIACAVSDLSLLFPVIILFTAVKDIMNAVNGNPFSPDWYMYGFGIAALIIVVALLYYIRYNATFLATYKESARMRISLAERLRKLPLSFFGKKDLADLTSTIMADSATMETAFSHWIPEFAGSIIATVLAGASLFAFDWRMALAALWVLPVSLAIVFFSRRVQQKAQKKLMDAKMTLADGIQEELEAARDIKAANAEAKYLLSVFNKVDAVREKNIRSEITTAAFVVSAQLILKLGIATVALVGGLLIKDSSLDLITFFVFLLVVSRLYDPISSVLQNLAAIISLASPIRRMNEINNQPVQTGASDTEIKSFDISFENVGFSYNDGESVLSDVSFTAKQNEITALIGPSGGGKSTIAKLAARFWDVDRGRITLGGNDISKIDPEHLLEYYSIVFQDVTLFNASVTDNIRLGRKNATDEEVLKAAKDAQCDLFAKNLPQGYDTVIGENGAALSGGERQRISIARAMLKNAPIVILDEATASLDAENETLVQEALSRLVKNKTVLIIAHRMRTVANADKLIFLKNGAVSEQGTPEALYKSGGSYYKMLEIQKMR
jgi:ATP-binding cassette subfamily B protein